MSGCERADKFMTRYIIEICRLNITRYCIIYLLKAFKYNYRYLGIESIQNKRLRIISIKRRIQVYKYKVGI